MKWLRVLFDIRWRVVLASALLVVMIMSCRVPPMPVMEDPAVAYIYDPKTADLFVKGSPSEAVQRELNARYRTALAEPVSVVGWEDDHSESEIYFATNRTAQTAANGEVQFGPVWGQELSLGTCRVTLPRGKKRGASPDPPTATAKLVSWLPGLGQADKKQEVQAAVGQGRAIEPADYFTAVRETVARAPEHDVLIFVHGFNVDFAGSVTRAAQIALDMPFNGAVIAYSWPSQGGVGNYDEDAEIVLKAVNPFRSFLDQLNQSLPPETRIHIIVHSMGNRLVVHGLSLLPEIYRHPPRFENIVLAAPDVGVSEFVSLSPYVVSTAKRVTLYVNQSDTALIISKAVNREQRIGDSFPAVVVPGVETVDASAIDLSFMGHSYYGSNRRALSDLFALIKENQGATERVWLRSESSPSGSWWVFASQPNRILFAWYFDDLKKK